MKLLLVDDEEYVIESIKRNLDLTETGVSEVYTAFSVQQAKNIMGMVDIDIVISDIVMPGGTGFDFVEWVRKEELKVQVIFLTSYAEFDYARRAIQLNSVDYLLKPIDFEKLKAAVQRAAESVAKEKKIQDLRQESIKWNQNRKILQQDIWKNVLKSGFSEEKFCETAAQRQLSYGPGHYFRLICLMPEIKSNKREMWDTATMEFVIENVLSELYEETDIAVDTVFYQEPGIYWQDGFLNLGYILKNKIKPTLAAFISLVRVGYSVFFEQVFMRIGFMMTAIMAAKQGTDAMAAHQVGMNIMSLSFAFGDGLQSAAVALIGRSLGAKKPDLAKEYGRTCRLIGAGIAVCLVAIYLFGGRWLYSLFFEEQHIIEIGVSIIHVIIFVVIFQICQVIYMGCLRGAGDTLYTAVASMISVTFIRTIVSYLGGYTLGLGIVGIWFGVLADQMSRFIFATIRFKQGKWVKIKI